MSRQHVDPEHEGELLEQHGDLEEQQHVGGAEDPTDGRDQVVGRRERDQLLVVGLDPESLVREPRGACAVEEQLAVEDVEVGEVVEGVVDRDDTRAQLREVEREHEQEGQEEPEVRRSGPRRRRLRQRFLLQLLPPTVVVPREAAPMLADPVTSEAGRWTHGIGTRYRESSASCATSGSCSFQLE